MKNKKYKNSILANYIQLGKFSVILPVSLTAFTGFFLHDAQPGIEILLVTVGVFFLGISASALNQVQEMQIDALMQRTRNRPLPSKRISRENALVYVIVSFLAGSLLIFTGGNGISLLLGILTLFWYNGIYTPMKKHTAFAVIPGALTGAMPPVIGWTAAGGNLTDPVAIMLSFIFFMGQVPHFWLLILKYGDQYREAGLPGLTHVFSIHQINRLSFVWIAASLISAMVLASLGIIENAFIRWILAGFTLPGIFLFSGLLNRKERAGEKKHFLLLNIYYLFLILILITELLSDPPLVIEQQHILAATGQCV